MAQSHTARFINPDPFVVRAAVRQAAGGSPQSRSVRPPAYGDDAAHEREWIVEVAGPLTTSAKKRNVSSTVRSHL